MTVKNNVAVAAASTIVPQYAEGGGVYVSGSLTLTNTTIANNKAQGVMGLGGPVGANGGGVYVTGPSTVTMNGGSISGNSVIGGNGKTGAASKSGGMGGLANGGGLYVIGPSAVTINGGSISNNSAMGGAGGAGGAGGTTEFGALGAGPGGTGGDAQGGGLYFSDGGWSLTLEGTTVSGNSAEGGAGGLGGNGLDGIDGSAGMAGTDGTNGTAASPNGGPGLKGISGSPGGFGTFGGAGGNGGAAKGGGAFFELGGAVTMSGVTFKTNSASGGIGGAGGAGGKGGAGGVGGTGGAGGNAYASPNAHGGAGGSGGKGTFGRFGGSGGIGGKGGAGSGGGLYVGTGPVTLNIAELSTPTSTTISSFVFNLATGGDGGFGGAGGNGGVGGIGGTGGGAGGSPGQPGAGGTGGNGGGGGIGGNGGVSGAASGGGLYVTTNSTVAISAANLEQNQALSGTGGIGGAGGNGGNGGNGGKGGQSGGETASSGTGGSGGNGGNGGNGGIASKAQGGAIYTQSQTSIVNSSLIQNAAIGGGGGSGGDGGNGGDAGIGSRYISINGGGGGTGGKGATSSPGGGGTANGGGVYLTGSAGPDLVINTTFGQNDAIAGGAGLGGSKGVGGLNASGNPTLRQRSGNDGMVGTPGTGNGGGAYATVKASTAFINDTFYWNSATTQGGGIWTNHAPKDVGSPLVVNTILENNQSLDGPDYWGGVNALNSFDFVSNTINSNPSGGTWGSPGSPPPGTILNNNTPQLENTLSSVTLLGGGKSPYFYRLLPGSLVVNGGTSTVVHDIAVAEGVTADDATVDETLIDPRTNDSGNQIDMGAVQFQTSYSTLNISFLPSTANTVPFGTKSVSVEVSVSQGTNPGNLPINGGTVTFVVQQGGTMIGTVTANVSAIGIASATIPLPANLPAGAYTITATYANANGGPANPHGVFSSTAVAGLTITAPPPAPTPPPPPPPPLPLQVAALEVALDEAALLSLGNPGALLELQLLSNVFLQHALPASVPALIADIQSLYPQTGVLGLNALAAGVLLSRSLPQPNP
jgi:hypothetical protein